MKVDLSQKYEELRSRRKDNTKKLDFDAARRRAAQRQAEQAAAEAAAEAAAQEEQFPTSEPVEVKESFTGRLQSLLTSFTGGNKLGQGLGQSLATSVKDTVQPFAGGLTSALSSINPVLGAGAKYGLSKLSDSGTSKTLGQIQDAEGEMQQKLIQAIRKNKAEGRDTARLEASLSQLTGGIAETGAGAEDLLNPNKLTAKQVVGDSLQLATTAGTLGALPIKGASGVVPALKQGAKVGAGAGALTGAAQTIKNDGSIGDTLSNAAFGGLTGGIVGGALGGATGVVSKVASSRATKAAASKTDDVLELVRKPLNKKEQVDAMTKGLGSREGLLKKVVIKPSKKDLEISKAAEGIVSTKVDPFENIYNLREAVDTSATELRQGLSQSKAIWNRNELKGILSKIEKPITVKSDKTLNNQADNLKKAVLELAAKADKKHIGLLDLRQEFDSLVRREYPNLYDQSLTPSRQYIYQLRDALNDFTEQKIPNGVLPNGVTFKDSLRQQHLLLDAIENIAQKAPKEGKSAITVLLEKYPLLKESLMIAGGSIVGGGIIGAGINSLD